MTKRFTATNVGQTSIDEFGSIVSSIYSLHDIHRSIWDIWAHANHHAAGIAEEARKNLSSNEKGLQEIADFALWLFTTFEKLQGQVGIKRPEESERDSLIKISALPSNLIWNRYPAVCPWCYFESASKLASDHSAPVPCKCAATKVERRGKSREQERTRAIESRMHAEKHQDNKPDSL